MLKYRKAFTLVEIIIVVAVISILTAILIPVILNMTNKATSSSALSDAKNAATKLNLDITDFRGHCVFEVKKGGKYYLYSFKKSDGKLIESRYNPLNADSFDDLTQNLMTDSVIYRQYGYSGDDDYKVKVSDNVTALLGFSLNDRQFDRSVYLLAGDMQELPALSGDNISWSIDNAETACIEGGKIKALAVGETTMRAQRNGQIIAEYKVCVTEVVEVTSLSELKAETERNTPCLFIRLISDGQKFSADSSDNIFPIVVPCNKFVYLDMTRCYIECNYRAADIPEALFINDGGEFHMVDTDTFGRIGSVALKVDGRDSGTSDEIFSVIKNQNQGLLFADNINFDIAGGTGGTAKTLHCLYNESGRANMNTCGFLIDNSNMGFTHPDNTVIKNCANGVMSIENDDLDAAYINYVSATERSKPVIVNDGYISKLRNLGISVSVCSSGTIDNIANCKFLHNREDGTPALIVEKGGIIGKVDSCTFSDVDMDEFTESGGDISIYAVACGILVKGGCKVRILSDVTSYCGETVRFENAADKSRCIESGRFYFEPAGELLFEGKQAVYDSTDKMYVVE